MVRKVKEKIEGHEIIIVAQIIVLIVLITSQC